MQDQAKTKEQLIIELRERVTELEKDQAERKRAEEALRKSEKRYRSLVETSSDWLWEIDANGRYTYVSSRAREIFGYAPEEVIGRTPFDLMPEEEARRVGAIFAEIAAERRPFSLLENVNLHRDGRRVVLETSGVPVFGPDGEFAGYRGIDRDITERKRTEEALQQSEREKAILNQIANVFLTIPDEKIFEGVLAVILKAFKCRYGVFGYIGDGGDLIIPSMTKEILSDCQVAGKYMGFPRHLWGNSLWGKAIKEKKSFSSTGPFETPEGHLPVYNYLTVPIVFADNTIGLVSVANKDGGFSEEDKTVLERVAGNISPILSTRLQRDKQELERKRAEVALRESQQMLHLILDTIPVRVFWKDLDINYLGCNRPFALDAGLQSPEEIVGRSDFEMGWSEQAQLYRSDDLLVIETGRPKLGYEEPQTTPSGDRIWLRSSKVPLFDVKGEIKGVLGTYEDITVHKRAEEQLREAHHELEQRVEERTASLEEANEELRQIPSKLIAVQEEERKRLASELHDSIGQTLAAVKFWVEMALKLKDAGDGNAALNRLEQFVPILQRSIEETRNIYMGLRPSMLDSQGLLATLEWLRHECMKLYPERHIELEAGIAEEAIPKNLKVNIFRIAQEALNNIAKHSKAEWVDISFSENGGGIELVVSDDGVGMDLDIIMQTSTATSLGLTSMRERAELTGGSFSIESTPGKGTTIRAYWPIQAEDQPLKGGIAL